MRGELARDSLRLGVQPGLDPSARIAWLASHLGDFTGSGIVYTLTVSAAEDITRILRDQGHEVRAYTGRTDAEERAELEQMLKDNRLKALIATSALGMGFDKPDLGFVVHVGAPSSAVAYYQQVGRAGRATERADVLLVLVDHDEFKAVPATAANLADFEARRAEFEAKAKAQLEGAEKRRGELEGV